MGTGRKHAAAGLIISAVLVAACSDQPTAPRSIAPALTIGVVKPGLSSPQWQQRARALVSANNQSPVAAGRTYAALSVAQYRAVKAADKQLPAAGRTSGNGYGAGGRSNFEMQRGAVAGASAVVLSFLYPSAAAALEQQVDAEGQAGPGNVHPSFTKGEVIGRIVGQAMVTHLMNDGSSLPFTGTVPVGPQYWIPTPTMAGANLGGVTPYFLNSTSQFRSAPPPALASAEFTTDLNEVVNIAAARTPQQIAIAQFWAFGGGTPTPLGYWNQVAADYIAEAGLDERAATHVFALMHGAQFDAQLGCFETKYHYWTVRPYQVVSITTALAPPPHPSYPSGHSCISASAAHVLAYFFPQKTAELDALVAEAGVSRIYAGIHYRFDLTAGKILGTTVADWAIARDQASQ